MHTKGWKCCGMIAVTMRTLALRTKCKTKPDNPPVVFHSLFLAWRQYCKSNKKITRVCVFSGLISTTLEFYMFRLDCVSMEKYFRVVWNRMNSKQQQVQHQEMELLSLFVDRITIRYFQVIGHPAELGWKHIPYVFRLMVESLSELLLFLSDCRCQTSKSMRVSVCASLCIRSGIVCLRVFVDI